MSIKQLFHDAWGAAKNDAEGYDKQAFMYVQGWLDGVLESRRNVLKLRQETKADLPAQQVLEGAMAFDLQEVLVLAADRQGRLMMFASTGRAGVNNLLLDCAKVQIVNSAVVLRPMEPLPPETKEPE